LIAAEKTGRRARILELNPIYVDVTIERWQRLTGKLAYHAKTGRPFSSVNNQPHKQELERRHGQACKS
jgi:DNA modification methylase